MTARLLHGGEAVLDIRKIADYCLSPSHPRGRHKARVFRGALDLQRRDAAWLREVLPEAARSSEGLPDFGGPLGDALASRCDHQATGKSAVVRTIWIVRTGEKAPRFVTCYAVAPCPGSELLVLHYPEPP